MDKGYDSQALRQWLRQQGFIAHIPRRGQKPEPKPAGAKARRWVVEQTHSWLNRYRRLLVRWEKKAANYEAMLHLAAGIIAFQQAGLFG
ncbi:transposase [Tepidiphilus succinatimandens]|uniref:transposase n=1 Tax=Tepidiphilus succinatimandens TaxID=224436 RepID=UPI0023EF5241|nr:transposase [Tepidiphilus succinatimandens]